MIHIDDEDMRPFEQYGPAFIKRNENGRLYKSQMFRSCTNSIKENAWERDYGVDLKEIRKTHLNTFAHSKVKGFMWLFTSHALPVGARLRRKETDNRCPHCMEVEDIKHMAFDCIVAKNIRDMVFTEWWSRTTESWWLNHPKFEEAFFNEGTFEVLRRTLNDIATYHIWRYRCNILYRGEITPTVVTANNIWVEFTQTLRARLSHIKAKANWWTYRDEVQMVPKAITDQYLGKIEVEQSVLLALFPDWERSRPSTPVSLETLNNLSPYKDNVHGRGQGYSLPPTFPTFDPNWKIWTSHKPTWMGTLDAPDDRVATSSGTSSSFNGSVYY
jgi:hypothetical protein